jgi:glycosyltransferase involved in cell wall biosynthesis
MFFKYIHYISPSWYFNLSSNEESFYCVDYHKLNSSEQDLIAYDNDYTCKTSQLIDAAYQAFQKGIIKGESFALAHNFPVVDVEDNYRFVKKYFNPVWLFYIFFIRVITLNNPFKELTGLAKSFSVRKINLFNHVYENYNYNSYHSKLLDKQPFISVIIPTLNRYTYLKKVLQDLEYQTYKKFELLIYDQSVPFQADFYNDCSLDLKVVKQSEKALWLARNTAIQNAVGEYILLYDDDSIVAPDWIENHIKCIDYFKADISSGVSISVAGAKVPKHYSFFRWSDQVDTGNVMLRKDIFGKIGLFDRQFEKQRQGDGEFGLRAYLAGYKNISNPLAKRIHLKVKDGGLREMGSWDAFRPKKLLAPRPIPSVLYMTRKYFGNQAAILSCIINVPPSIIPYKYKKNKLIPFFGILISILFFPLIVYTVFKSWFISSRMLKEGPKIDVLNNLVLND